MTHSQTQGAVGAETRTAGQSLDLRDLHAANIARQAEWCPDQVPDLSFRGNELGGECGEAQNVIKKLERERQGWRGSRATKDDLADELADVVICADLCAVTADIDLGAAVRRKFNATSEKEGLSVFLPLPALASPRADSDERTAGVLWSAWSEDDCDSDPRVDPMAQKVTEWFVGRWPVGADEPECRILIGSGRSAEIIARRIAEKLTSVLNTDAIQARKAATPAQPAGAVPDGLRALSEAFAQTACCASCTTPVDCYQGKPCRLEPAGSGSGLVDHEFKSHPDVFWPAARGEKTFEYRRDDRGGYEVGQTVRLRCYDPTRGYHDTAPLDRRITNILRGGEFELPMGYCILSLAPLSTHPAGQSAGSGAEIRAGDPIAQILFERMAAPAEQPYRSKYQDQADMPVPALQEVRS